MTEDLPPITPSQGRAARALVGWSLETLAKASGIPVPDLKVFEAERLAPSEACARSVRTALEAAGVVFLPEVDGSGVGVRLKFPRQTVKRTQAWEGEGGTTGEDDIA